jgi:hypothetical protein
MLLALSLALAQPQLIEHSPIRYELVYQTARRVCPVASRYPNKTAEQYRRLLHYLRDTAGFTADEANSMLNHCIMYSLGRHSRR